MERLDPSKTLLARPCLSGVLVTLVCSSKVLLSLKLETFTHTLWSASLLERALPLELALGQRGADPIAIALKCQTTGASGEMRECITHLSTGALV